MLALTRKKGEALVINNNVPVYRKEVYLQIQKENQEAISLDGIEALKGILG